MFNLNNLIADSAICEKTGVKTLTIDATAVAALMALGGILGSKKAKERLADPLFSNTFVNSDRLYLRRSIKSKKLIPRSIFRFKFNGAKKAKTLVFRKKF
jgi:hypothetical protein